MRPELWEFFLSIYLFLSSDWGAFISFFFQLALMIWRDELFKPCSRALMSAVLNEIERERRGDSIAATRLSIIIGSLVELSLTSELHAPVNGVNFPPAAVSPQSQV